MSGSKTEKTKCTKGSEIILATKDLLNCIILEGYYFKKYVVFNFTLFNVTWNFEKNFNAFFVVICFIFKYF